MKNPYLILSFIVLCTGLFNTLTAQTQITGLVVDEGSKSPIEFATVMLVDTANGNSVDGAITDANGYFEINTEASGFVIQVSFIGFEGKTISDYSIVKGKVDLGTISLSMDSQMLNEAVVVGQKSQMEFRLDKRVFNVGTDLTAAGANALEVLNNVPSVSVDIEGQISLRGNQGVQVLINGKPSILTNDGGGAFGTITADMIEKVEVITNPSAEYQAEGTSGIINIVLKKEKKKGFSGSVTLNGGYPTNNSVGVSLNKRSEKWNLFTQMGAGRRTFPRYQENSNLNLLDSSEVRSDGETYKSETFYNMMLGADYYINKYNTLTLSGNVAYEFEDETSDFDFESFDASEPLESWKREEDTEATNPKYQYELQYARDFKRHEDQQLLLSATGNFFGKEKSSTFEDRTIQGERDDSNQFTNSDLSQSVYTFKADYDHPFAENFIFETGAHYQMDDISNDYANGNIVDGVEVEVSELTNDFRYAQNVLGLYGTLGYEGEKWGTKLGLRAENTDLQTELIQTNETNSQNFTNLFPSAHVSYNFNKRVSVQAGYSRRIERPSHWSLNPFVNIRNNFNLSTGNPNLLPEYSDSYELTGIWTLEKASFNAGVYHLYTTDVIERVTVFENNTSLRKPINIGTNNVTGIEFNAKYSPTNKVDIRGDFNLNAFQRDADFEGVSYDYDGTQWTTRVSVKTELPMQFEVELTGVYNSEFKTIQGKQLETAFANLGVRKKFMKGKLVANMSIRDIFASRVYQTITEEPSFITSTDSRRGRFFTLGVSYSLGKGQAMEYSARKRF